MNDINQLKIAIVDDDIVMIELFKYQIRKSGMKGFFFQNAEEFLKQAPYLKLNAIVLDQNLPDGTALEILDELKQNELNQGIPVYIMTGNVQDAELEDRLIQRAEHFFTKPFSPISVLNEITNYFKAHEVA